MSLGDTDDALQSLEWGAEVPVSKPRKVEGGFDKEIVESNDLDALGHIYTKTAVYLMRQTACDLMPTAYLHLTCDPYTGEKEDALYEMHVENSRDLPAPLVQGSFEILVRALATRGQCLSTVFIMQAVASLSSAMAEPDEAILVQIETREKRKLWMAVYTECDTHGLHCEEFRVISTVSGGPLPRLMKPIEVKNFDKRPDLGIDDHKARVDSIARTLGMDKVLGEEGYGKMLDDIAAQTMEREKQRKAKRG